MLSIEKDCSLKTKSLSELIKIHINNPEKKIFLSEQEALQIFEASRFIDTLRQKQCISLLISSGYKKLITGHN